MSGSWDRSKAELTGWRSVQREAAITRRLDKLTRAVERLDREVSIGNEALALFVRFWLTTTPPIPEDMQAAAQATGKMRYEGFVAALGRRLAKGKNFSREVSEDVGQPERDHTHP